MKKKSTIDRRHSPTKEEMEEPIHLRGRSPEAVAKVVVRGGAARRRCAASRNHENFQSKRENIGGRIDPDGISEVRSWAINAKGQDHNPSLS